MQMSPDAIFMPGLLKWKRVEGKEEREDADEVQDVGKEKDEVAELKSLG